MAGAVTCITRAQLPVGEALAQMGYRIDEDGRVYSDDAEAEMAIKSPPSAVDEQLRERLKFSEALLGLVDNENATIKKDSKTIHLKKWAYWEGIVDGVEDLIFRDGSVEINHLEWKPVTDVNYTFFQPLPKDTNVKVMLLRGRHDVWITQQPSAENDDSVIVHIDDWMGGEDRYQVILYYESIESQ